MATNIGPKIGIEGEKEYRDALKNIIQQTKTLGSEMEAVAASFGKSATEQEKAAAKTKGLEKQIAAQGEVVKQTAEMVARYAETFGQSDTRTLKWQQSLNKANTELSRLKNELTDTQDAVKALDVDPNVAAVDRLKESIAGIVKQSKVLSSEMEEVSASFGKNADAQEKSAAQAQVLQRQIENQRERVIALGKAVEASAKAYGETSAETSDFRIALNKANAELWRMDDELKNIVSGVDDLDESMDDAGKSTLTFGDLLKANLASDAIAAGIKATANALKSAAGAVIDLGKASVQGFADRQQLIGGVETLFGDAADTVAKNAENAFATAGISANAYMETVTSFSASLIAAVGDDTQLAAEKADMALRDMSDNANKMGTDMASIQNAYQGFAKQNYTMLDNLNTMGALAA